MDSLITKLALSKVKFDAIAPIMRSGAIPGMMIANKFQITQVIPLQLKYNYAQNCIDTLIPPILPKGLDKQGHILVVDCNTYTGGSASQALHILKEALPDAHFHYACITKVYDGPETIEGYESYTYGQMTNEAFKAQKEDLGTLNLRDGITIFPWETIEFELADINNA